MLFKSWLKVLSWPYYVMMSLRNLLYKHNLIKSKVYETPKIISIGNLTLGGTGKTPLALYLTYMLTKKHKVVAILSRGYKRSSKGFKIVNHIETPQTVGDEPYMYYQHFKSKANIVIAVCESRVTGIENLLQYRKDIEVVILDDAFQQRKIRPTINMLLTTFQRPFFKDYILPLGYLREPKQAVERANIVLVTKSPENLSQLNRKNIQKTIKTFYKNNAHPQIFFTHITYKNPTPFGKIQLKHLPKTLLLVTGIAFPQPLQSYLEQQGYKVAHLIFRDHHWFDYTDLLQIQTVFNRLTSKHKALVTTEKDSIRLIHNPWYKLLDNIPSFYIPIRLTFKPKDQHIFEAKIIHQLL